MSGRLRFVYATLVLLVASAVAVYAFATPEIQNRLLLSPCLIPFQGPASECAFEIIQQKIEKEGMLPALDVFVAATQMFPTSLDYDCHSAAHRFGDMVYYSLFFGGNLDMSGYEYPRHSMVCNRAFFHGLFEHMFQDRPDPRFIAETCSRFKTMQDPALHEVANSCFHAAGHGLFRYQAELVKPEDYGNAAAFINNPVKICKSMPDITEHELFVCITGIQSMFIISNLRWEYGFKDPDPSNPYAVCNLLSTDIQKNCWSVRAIMLGHMDNDYPHALRGCENANAELFELCIRGIIIGVFTNGVTPKSFSRLVEFCSEEIMRTRKSVDLCFERLATQLGLEYRAEPVDCRVFPAEYRPLCVAALAT